METRIIRENLEEAAEILRWGGLAAVPTETVYGLAGNGLDPGAVRRIYEVKGRPEIKPLALMVPGAEEMERYCAVVPPAAKTLAERFWPGPLSIVLKAKTDVVPDIVRAGGETVSLRCPDHPMTLETLRLAGIPFAAPSANPSSRPSPRTAEEVLDYFSGQIEAVIDGGPCGIGRESTIIDLSGTPYRILRQGALAEEEIADALAEKMTLIGITGGSGSGKTTALQVLRKRGALVIDCDRVYHELLENSEELIRELDEGFPGTVVDGKLDRKKLGAVVFTDEAALTALNAITHRHILCAVRDMLRTHAMQGGEIAAIDAVELISSGLAERCDLTVGILADPEIRLRRIMERDSIGPEEARLRLQAQRPDSYYIDNCDVVVFNNGSAAAFETEFLKQIKERHGNG